MTRVSPAPIHGLIRKPVRNLVVFAEGVTNFEVFELADQLLRLVVQLAQFRMTHLVNPFQLANHEFGIADHFERFDLVLGRITKRREQALILGVVVSVVPKVFAELGDRMAGGVLNRNAITGRPGIPAGSAIDVGSVHGGRGFRRGEKITGVG